MDWTHVAIATDAVIWTKPSLMMDSKDLKLPLCYHLLFLDFIFQQTFPFITLRPLLPVSQVNLEKIITRVVGILIQDFDIASTQFDRAFDLRLVPKFL